VKHRYSIYIPVLSLVGDLVLLNLSFLLAAYLKFGSFDSVSKDSYPLFWLLINLSWIALTLILKSYTISRLSFTLSHLALKLLFAVSVHAAIVSLFFTATQSHFYSRIHLASMYLMFFSSGMLIRSLWFWLIIRYRLKGYNSRKYIIIGGFEQAKTIIRYHELHPEYGFRFSGFFGSQNNHYWNGSFEDACHYIKENRIDFIYCYAADVPEKLFDKIIEIAQWHDSEIKFFTDHRYIPNRMDVEYHSYVPIFKLLPRSFYETKEAVLKRCFDVLFSTIALISLAPILIFVGIITALSSKGPVIYCQKRTGRLGHPFTIYKFRSMYVHSGQFHPTGSNDSRITPWGRFMRKTKLDELPQFINVILGDMSVVGPRPLADYDSELLFREMPEEYRMILSFKPGITSIGQIQYGYAHNADQIKERAQIDLKYVPSFRQDLYTIIRTTRVILGIKRIKSF
jgi:exopolysaccharide biosynthesis polyprenyl glycosylphosphotransferase